MQQNIPPRGTIRLTRRGRLVLILLATGVVVAGAAVVVPLVTVRHGVQEAEPASLVIPEGWRASQVYGAVDKALHLPAGSTEKALPKAHLKLPTDAAGNPEGYLFPATYPVTKKTTPESLLSFMVNTANKKFNGAPIAAGAQRNAMNVYQAVTVASIVQAEAASKADMGKVARVVFNRLERGMPLQMDSTLNYALKRATLKTSADDTKLASPYNSYQRMGLPPTPIDNPGEEAMRAAVNPPAGDWLYFVTVKPGDTRFTADFAEHQRNVAEFNARQNGSAPQATQSSSAPQATQSSSAPQAAQSSSAPQATQRGSAPQTAQNSSVPQAAQNSSAPQATK